MTLPDLYLLEGSDWETGLVPVCEWGCCTVSAVDCSKPDGNMLLFVDGVTRVDQKATFTKWLEDWLAGVDVGSDSYRAANQTLKEDS